MLVLSLAAVIVPASTVTADPGTIQVDVNDGACVASPQVDPYSCVYCNIQDAVTDAASGDTIIVATGTYIEDITIAASKTNLELRAATGASVTIKGVQELDWPTHAPCISILASGVKIHGFTIESPDYSRTTGNPHSSGIAVGAADVEIYDNAFVSTDDGTGFSAGWCTAIETYGAWAGDVSGLYIHDNTFTSNTGTDKGSEGIYINYNSGNPNPTGTVTISNNAFGGQIFRAITTERSKTTITGNTISSSYAAGAAFNLALRGIDVSSTAGNLNPNQDRVSITVNTVNGFYQGIKLGGTGITLTNIIVTRNSVQTCDTGVAVYSSANGVVVNFNNITGNALGVDNRDSANTLYAKNNWWGYRYGPEDTTGSTECLAPAEAGWNCPCDLNVQPSGQLGDAVSDDVDYCPWRLAPATGCFIATAAYGTSTAEQIDVLRDFCD